MLTSELCTESRLPIEPKLRHKSQRRRFGREIRLFSPLLALGVAVFLLASTIAALERGSAAAEIGYFSTILKSSTSNVSTAPPGTAGGAPRSP